jgi:hypothetical protein
MIRCSIYHWLRAASFSTDGWNCPRMLLSGSTQTDCSSEPAQTNQLAYSGHNHGFFIRGAPPVAGPEGLYVALLRQT